MYRVGKFQSVILCAGIFLAQGATAAAVRGDYRAYREVRGLKFPNPGEVGGPIAVRVRGVRTEEATSLPGYSELVEFALPSPNQLDAGTCLYMTLTGIAEWWLARLSPHTSRLPDGPLDLSERYLMNRSDEDDASKVIVNWKTDSIYAYNLQRRSPLNRDYRFTMGWYKNGEKGYERALPNEFGAEYGAPFSWVNDLAAYRGPSVSLPKFRRDVIFADPASNQWNVGVMPANVVQLVKTALQRNRAPVQVIYNHYGYWHSNYIVGFDDTGSKQGCPFVTKFREHQLKEAVKLREEAARTSDAKKKEALLARATKFEGTAQKLDESWRRRGGCKNRGVFYVRDSIYEGEPNAPVYDYDRYKKGEEEPYSKRIVLLEYEWLEHMANHAIQFGIE